MTVPANISSDKIVAIRRKTGAGIMDCKRAVQEASGDMDRAVEILRKKGLADLSGRMGRSMKEGVVAAKISDDGKAAAMVELDCETDFSARNPEFKELAASFVLRLLETSISDPANDPSIKDNVAKLAAKMGENMQFRRSVRYQLSGSGVLNYYIHTDSKKGALVELGFEGQESSASLPEAAREIALQVVAMSPGWISGKDVPPEVVAKEKEIYRANALNQGKPERAVEKMLEGRMKKFFRENCLLEQASIRDSKTTVSAMLEQASAKVGGALTVKRFENYLVGAE